MNLDRLKRKYAHLNDIKNKLLVQSSSIHGQGLFTTVKIPKNKLLGRCSTSLTETPSDYSLLINNDNLYNINCVFRFINHSSKPNIIIYDDFDVVALRDIQKDEELFHDYGWE